MPLMITVPHGHSHENGAGDSGAMFLHLLRHLQENDRHILELLTSQNNEIFLRYFKSNLKTLILTQYANKGLLKNHGLPTDYMVNHIAAAFVETVDWWLSRKMQETPEEITGYFLAAVGPML